MQQNWINIYADTDIILRTIEKSTDSFGNCFLSARVCVVPLWRQTKWGCVCVCVCEREKMNYASPNDIWRIIYPLTALKVTGSQVLNRVMGGGRILSVNLKVCGKRGWEWLESNIAAKGLRYIEPLCDQ